MSQVPNQTPNPNVPGAFLTGSDSKTPICLVDGNIAYQNYGVERKSGGPCPGCKFPVSLTLAFNPTDSYWYFGPCPVCLKTYRWMDPNGNIDDLKEVKSTKRTSLDEDEDVVVRTGTF